MEKLTIRAIDQRVLFRLITIAANNGRPTSDEARDVLSRAVGIEPKSGRPPPPKGVDTPIKVKGFEDLEVCKKSLTVYRINQRLMGKLRAAAKRNKRTVSAEARAMIMEAVGYDPPLPKGVINAYEALEPIFAQIRELGLKMPTREELLYGPSRRPPSR